MESKNSILPVEIEEPIAKLDIKKIKSIIQSENVNDIQTYAVLHEKGRMTRTELVKETGAHAGWKAGRRLAKDSRADSRPGSNGCASGRLGVAHGRWRKYLSGIGSAGCRQGARPDSDDWRVVFVRLRPRAVGFGLATERRSYLTLLTGFGASRAPRAVVPVRSSFARSNRPVLTR